MAQYAAERAESVAPAIANPAPLGLSAFALTTFVLSCSNAGFLFSKSEAGGAIVLGLALFYGGIVQLVAGIQEFRTGNTFGATAFCSYAGFWMSFAFVLLPLFGGNSIVVLIGTPSKGVSAAVAASDVGTAVGIFLLGWTIFTGWMFIATFRISGALIAVFGLLFLTFLCLTIGALGGGSTHTTFFQIGGWLGIITALAAWYTAFAAVLASVKLMNLPTMPMNRS